MRSIESFLRSRGWRLGKHSAVDNSAYVHRSRGLWVSQEGRALRLCPRRRRARQLYGNGRQGRRGRPPGRLGRSRSAHMLPNRGARLRSGPPGPDSTGARGCDTDSGSAFLSFCRPGSPAGTQARTEPRPPATAQPGAQSAPRESSVRAGCSGWQSAGGTPRSRMVRAGACCVSSR